MVDKNRSLLRRKENDLPIISGESGFLGNLLGISIITTQRPISNKNWCIGCVGQPVFFV